jgi:hypothetical protein
MLVSIRAADAVLLGRRRLAGAGNKLRDTGITATI